MARLPRTFCRLIFSLFIASIFAGIPFQFPLANDGEIVFALQGGTPAAIQNFTSIESGCNWTGIGGQVFDQQGNVMVGSVIKVYGVLEGTEILLYAVTGGSQLFGPGGYLLRLTDHLVASTGTLRLQVLDVSGNEISPPISFNTYADCTRNLIVLNVKEYAVLNPVHFPIIRR